MRTPENLILKSEMCDLTLVLSVHQLKEDPCFLKALTTYLFDEISHLILFFKSKDKRPTTKEEKKEQKRKLKNPNPEECSVGVFDPRSCKKAAHAKLNIFLETSGNSKQTTINGEVSFVDLFLWLPILLRCNFLIWHHHATRFVQVMESLKSHGI